MVHLMFDVHAQSKESAVEKVQEYGNCVDHAWAGKVSDSEGRGLTALENVGIKGYFDHVTAENILFVEDSDKEPASI